MVDDDGGEVDKMSCGWLLPHSAEYWALTPALPRRALFLAQFIVSTGCPMVFGWTVSNNTSDMSLGRCGLVVMRR